MCETHKVLCEKCRKRAPISGMFDRRDTDGQVQRSLLRFEVNQTHLISEYRSGDNVVLTFFFSSGEPKDMDVFCDTLSGN